MRWIAQMMRVTLINLRSMPRRLGSALAAAVGVAGVVAVMVAVLSIAEGFRETLSGTGSAERVIVLRSGSDSELSSGLDQDQVNVVLDAPGILRTADGSVASPELFVIVDLPKRSTGTEANVPLRGVTPAAFRVRGGVRVVEGRDFEFGRNEIIAGVGAAAQFEGIDVGNTLRWGESEWTVVGVFEAGGGLSESELWCDVKVLQPAYRRGNSYQSVHALLASSEDYDALKDALTTDPRVDVRVVRESDYYASQSQILYAIITGLGTLVASLMAIGAIFGAVNTMYSAVAARTREIATLHALGFGGGAVALSVLVESTLVAVAGGLVGGTVAYLAFNGYQATTLNWQSFSQVVFAFRVTPGLMVAGLALSLALGLIGGLFPAIRAARLPVASALREL